jgi:hypothetical protein
MLQTTDRMVEPIGNVSRFLLQQGMRAAKCGQFLFHGVAAAIATLGAQVDGGVKPGHGGIQAVHRRFQAGHRKDRCLCLRSSVRTAFFYVDFRD